MPRYKRTFDDAELEAALEPVVQTDDLETQRRLRNMWEFASLMQYIYLFGSVVKIDNDVEIDDLEAECLAPQPSQRLAQIGLQLLKFVSSHRGLTPEIFDEYTRRQYVAKAPHRNPYGEQEEPAKFDEFDVFTKVRVLHQLSTWTLGNPERLRGMMSQEEDQLGWRIEPIGWDRDDRAYFVLDDDRLYRRTDEPTPPPTPKQKSKPKAKPARNAKTRGTRTSKRLKIEDEGDEESDATDARADSDADDDSAPTNGEMVKGVGQEEESGLGFTSKTWECIAITLDEYRDFLASIFRTRDPNEKQLRRTIEDDVLPIIEKRADQVRQRQLKKIRELENLQKMATAKRSNRLADKAEKEKMEREEREADEKRQREIKMAHEEQERRRRIEEGHESRRLTREQRLRDREVKRILHEEELTKLEDAANRASSQGPTSDAGVDGHLRMSERQITSQKERHQKELEKMAEEEENWVFDCGICGIHGENWDDGTHSIACERCNVWQHSKCHGFSPKQAERDGFHFVCGTCKRKEAEAKKPKIPPLKLGKRKSPEVQIPRPSPPSMKPAALPDHIARQLDDVRPFQPNAYATAPCHPQRNGPGISTNDQTQGQHFQNYPPVSNFALQPRPTAQPWVPNHSLPSGMPSSTGYMSSSPPVPTNGCGPLGQHQQQHQYMHQNSVAFAGGHRGYQPPYNGQIHNDAMTCVTYQSGPTPPQTQTFYTRPQSNSPQQARYQQPGAGSQSLTNGVQSPMKHAHQPPASPSQRTLSGQYPHPSMHPGQRSSYDSKAIGAASTQPYPQYTLQPPRHHAPFPAHAPGIPVSPHHQTTQSPHHLSNTPQSLQANSATLHDRTPLQTHPSPAGSNANQVAADGMSGPWPEASKPIPHKQDQGRAPPKDGPMGDGHVPPPVSLAPSPRQQQQRTSGPQSVPVKKMAALDEVRTDPLSRISPTESSLTNNDGREKSRIRQEDGGQSAPDVKQPSLSDLPVLSNGQPSANVEWKTAVPTAQAS